MGRPGGFKFGSWGDPAVGVTPGGFSFDGFVVVDAPGGGVPPGTPESGAVVYHFENGPGGRSPKEFASGVPPGGGPTGGGFVFPGEGGTPRFPGCSPE